MKFEEEDVAFSCLTADCKVGFIKFLRSVNNFSWHYWKESQNWITTSFEIAIVTFLLLLKLSNSSEEIRTSTLNTYEADIVKIYFYAISQNFQNIKNVSSILKMWAAQCFINLYPIIFTGCPWVHWRLHFLVHEIRGQKPKFESRTLPQINWRMDIKQVKMCS